MKLNINNSFNLSNTTTPVQSYEDCCIRDPQWNANLYGKMGNDVSVLKEEYQGNTITRELLVQPHAETVPVLVRTFAGNDALDYVEKTTYDFSKHTGTIETAMTNPAFAGTGSTATFKVTSDTPNTVDWTMNANVHANLRFIGGTVEQAVCSEVHAKNPTIQGHVQDHLNQNQNQKA
jgi:hypothetical protein